MSLLPTITGTLPNAAITMIARLARAVSDSAAPALPAATPAIPVPLPQVADTPGTFALTSDALRAALLQMGEAASAGNMELSAALAAMGHALTPESLTEARIAIAHAPGTSGAAYALARTLGYPATPAILRALQSVVGGIPANRALPPDLMRWLSLAVSPDTSPEAIAAQLQNLIEQRARSVEGHLTDPSGMTDAARHSRTLLLRLAIASEDGVTSAAADALAAHIEGQQLVNLASQSSPAPAAPVPLYFALPLLMGTEQSMIEMTFQRCDSDADADAESDAPPLQVTLRLATTRMGRLQATLTGLLSGKLNCAVCAERPATRRLLARRSETLASALQASGWPQCVVTCPSQSNWETLWAGGAALASPRTRVDRRA